MKYYILTASNKYSVIDPPCSLADAIEEIKWLETESYILTEVDSDTKEETVIASSEVII
jgi:hypothetical protein